MLLVACAAAAWLSGKIIVSHSVDGVAEVVLVNCVCTINIYQNKKGLKEVDGHHIFLMTTSDINMYQNEKSL
jgi:hypothetical protein